MTEWMMIPIINLPRTGPRPASSIPRIQDLDLVSDGMSCLKTQFSSQLFKN